VRRDRHQTGIEHLATVMMRSLDRLEQVENGALFAVIAPILTRRRRAISALRRHFGWSQIEAQEMTGPPLRLTAPPTVEDILASERALLAELDSVLPVVDAPTRALLAVQRQEVDI
jgi:hypothetical protein